MSKHTQKSPKHAQTHRDMAKHTDIHSTTDDFEVSTTRGTQRGWEGGTQSDTREKRERVANQ